MRRFAALAAATILAGAACASASNRPAYYSPIIGLRDVRVTGAGLRGGSIEIALAVYNPNQFTLHEPRFRYRILVGSDEVASGIYDAPITVPPNDSIQVPVPASISLLRLGSAGRAVLNTGSLNYRVVGDLIVQTQHGRYSSRYDRAGWFNAMEAVISR